MLFCIPKILKNESNSQPAEAYKPTGDRQCNAFQSVVSGMNEKTIIKQVRDHYTAIHPTQKPVRLLERLLRLVIPMKKDKIVIADWFAGSFSCGEAVINLQAEFPEKAFEFVGTEIDAEYFESGKNRINNIKICTP